MFQVQWPFKPWSHGDLSFAFSSLPGLWWVCITFFGVCRFMWDYRNDVVVPPSRIGISLSMILWLSCYWHQYGALWMLSCACWIKTGTTERCWNDSSSAGTLLVGGPTVARQWGITTDSGEWWWICLEQFGVAALGHHGKWSRKKPKKTPTKHNKLKRSKI